MKRRFIYLSIIYLLIILAFDLYYSANVERLARIKGDEYFDSVGFLLVLTYLYYAFVYFTIFRKGIFFFILVPLGLVVVSFLMSFLIEIFFQLKGGVSQTVFIYTITGGYLAIGAVIYWRYLAGDFA